ncbi:SubName: Full=Uncharacterized protein {ECO:0000313/EMBL:CCA73712.1} [Serendipita indica DSM 11827]|nr:SubName: Full=Uncharacterized protein {ECO:0000313/EMBL:CCA73712.1} [Serendipita indica DSM 11827]
MSNTDKLPYAPRCPSSAFCSIAATLFPMCRRINVISLWRRIAWLRRKGRRRLAAISRVFSKSELPKPAYEEKEKHSLDLKDDWTSWKLVIVEEAPSAYTYPTVEPDTPSTIESIGTLSLYSLYGTGTIDELSPLLFTTSPSFDSHTPLLSSYLRSDNEGDPSPLPDTVPTKDILDPPRSAISQVLAKARMSPIEEDEEDGMTILLPRARFMGNMHSIKLTPGHLLPRRRTISSSLQ